MTRVISADCILYVLQFISYRYDEGDFWHSWPRSQSIDNFLETNGRDIIREIISSMVTGVYYM